MKTCVSLVKAISSIKDLNKAHEHLTWCQEYVVHLSLSDLPHLSQYKRGKWSIHHVC